MKKKIICTILVTALYEAWDEETHTVVEKEVTYCSRCHAQR